MKRSVAKRTLNAAMVDTLLIKGEAKDVVIRVDVFKTTAATMIAVAMIAAAAMAVAMMTTAMTVPVTATGMTTDTAAPITKGVASAMITTMTGRAIALMRLTMATTETMLHAAPFICAHIADPGVALTTLTGPTNLMALVAPKDHIILLLEIMP